MKLASKYKIGDRVVNLRGPRGSTGVIVKPAPVYPLVRWDGRNEDARTRAEDIRPETARDVTHRVHEQTKRAWQNRKPQTTHVKTAYTPYTPYLAGVEIIGVLHDPEIMRKVAAELLQLADWFAERPVEL
jgi:hypothetical protein